MTLITSAHDEGAPKGHRALSERDWPMMFLDNHNQPLLKGACVLGVECAC